jgi:hypothetical protein
MVVAPEAIVECFFGYRLKDKRSFTTFYVFPIKIYDLRIVLYFHIVQQLNACDIIERVTLCTI